MYQVLYKVLDFLKASSLVFIGVQVARVYSSVLQILYTSMSRKLYNDSNLAF